MKNNLLTLQDNIAKILGESNVDVGVAVKVYSEIKKVREELRKLTMKYDNQTGEDLIQEILG